MVVLCFVHLLTVMKKLNFLYQTHFIHFNHCLSIRDHDHCFKQRKRFKRFSGQVVTQFGRKKLHRIEKKEECSKTEQNWHVTVVLRLELTGSKPG